MAERPGGPEVRRLDDALIDRGLEAVAIDWQTLLIHVAERKFGSGGSTDRNALARRGRHLQQRGFPISLIRRYLNGLSLDT